MSGLVRPPTPAEVTAFGSVNPADPQSAPGIAELIRAAQEHPAKPVVEGLLHEQEIAGLHGSPESFKTILTLQLAESLATARPFLGVWPIPQPRRVYFFETEMSVSALGNRLRAMFQGRDIPQGVAFASEQQLRRFRRAPNVADKFRLLNRLIADAGADVAIIDTCNPFFRGKESPNDETTAGAFFDHLEALPVSTKVFVRHNHKPRMEDSDSASRIRGSGQFADVPDLLFEIRRTDKRINRAEFAVTKFRHGTKPDDVTLWFDRDTLRLLSLPPVIHLLRNGPLSRAELLKGLQKRFGIEQRHGDELIGEQRRFLQDHQRGHRRVFEIDRQAAKSAEWFPQIVEDHG